MGGLSGVFIKNSSRQVVNLFKLVIVVNSGGKMFHNLADFIVKLSS